MAENLREALAQFNDIQEEIKDVKEKITKIEEQIERIRKDGEVTDSVEGGLGGTQHFKITGFPNPEIRRKKWVLYSRRQQLLIHEDKLQEQIKIVEGFINKLDRSDMRRMITYRYLENMAWNKVARRMGGNNTADGCRVAVERFLEKL